MEQAAQLVGAECERINLSKDVTVEQLFGTVMPRFSEGRHIFEWQDGTITKALQEGKWVLLDEINLASFQVLEALIPLLDRSMMEYKIPGTDKAIRVDGIKLFATMNPASMQGGRSRLPSSFLSLFSVVRLDAHSDRELRMIMTDLFSEQLYKGHLTEQQITCIFNLHKAVCTRTSKREIGRKGGTYEFTLRDLSKVHDIVEGNLKDQILHYNRIQPSLNSEASSMSTSTDRVSTQQTAGQTTLVEGTTGVEVTDVAQIVVRKAIELVYKHKFQCPEDQQRVMELINKKIPAPAIVQDTNPSMDTSVHGCVRLGAVYITTLDLTHKINEEYTPLVHTPETIRQLEILASASQSKRAVLLEVRKPH